MKQQGIGSAALEVMNRGTEAVETWPKAPRKSVVVKKWWTTTFHPLRREESQDMYMFLCQRAKAELCFVVVPSPIHGDIPSSFVQLYISFTPLQRS